MEQIAARIIAAFAAPDRIGTVAMTAIYQNLGD
jgi:hypothetical protein